MYNTNQSFRHLKIITNYIHCEIITHIHAFTWKPQLKFNHLIFVQLLKQFSDSVSPFEEGRRKAMTNGGKTTPLTWHVYPMLKLHLSASHLCHTPLLKHQGKFRQGHDYSVYIFTVNCSIQLINTLKIVNMIWRGSDMLLY